MPTYLNGIKFIKESKFGFKFVINVDELVKETASLKDAKGNVKAEFSKRKEVGKWDETHSCKIDEWKPEPKTESTKTIDKSDIIEAADDLPF